MEKPSQPCPGSSLHQSRWHYTPKDAERTQVHMIENAFEVAKRADQEKGLEIIIEGFDA